jgi:hypothetical protein
VVIGTRLSGSYVEYGHGAAWAELVNDVADFINSPPSWASKLGGRGGSDMEPGFNSATETIDWADGYDDNGDWFYYNFGSADGCSPYGSCNNSWTQDDVWQISWGFSLAWPLPEIYCGECYQGDENGGNAAQWYEISLYGYLYKTGAVTMLGSLTQWAAAGGSGTNTPSDGWQQLYDALNTDWRTAQELAYSTDITWDN